MSLPASAARFEVEIVEPLAPPGGPRPPLRAGAVPARAGETLLRALQTAGAPVLSICGGQASCGACRVEIEAGWIGRLPPAGKVEAALLEVLEDSVPGHRLACQLRLTDDLHGLGLCLAP